MNSSSHSDNFLQAVLEGFVDGILIFDQQKTIIYTNKTAQSICHQFAPNSSSFFNEMHRVCDALLDSRELYSARSLVIESELTNDRSTIRIRGQYLTLESNAQPCIVIRLQDQNCALQGLAIAEAKQWGLTQRETEVWVLRRMDYSRKDIAADLYISLDTVKKHLKNIQQKRQTVLEQREWQLRRTG